MYYAHGKILLLSLLTAAALFWSTGAWAMIVTYAAPSGEVLSTEYRITIDGKRVDSYLARTLDPPFARQHTGHGGPYSFATFDMDKKATVRITSAKSLRNLAILPKAAGINPVAVDDHTVVFTLDRPRKLSIEPNGKNKPLLLFANQLEQAIPKPGDRNVIYFGPGIHRAGTITLGSGQTLYLAGGAVVKGQVLAQGSNIQIRGRGILDGSEVAWKAGPALIGIRNSHNVTIKDIILRGSSNWTIVPRNSDHLTVQNVKICNSRVQNDDGIDICNSQDVLITDCFIRSDDDCVALKGTDLSAKNTNVERIVVENCVLWCDRARVFLLGHESRAKFMRGITLRNLDIIHFSMAAFLFEPGEEMLLEDILVENVRVNGEAQRDLLIVRPTVNRYMTNQVPGHIRNVTFHNLSVEGGPGNYLITIAGADPSHTVQNIDFNMVSILNDVQTQSSDKVSSGKYVKNIRFNQGPTLKE